MKGLLMNYPINTNTKLKNAQLMLLEVKALKSEGKYNDALELGLKSLHKLGVHIKLEPGLWSILNEMNRTKGQFSLRRIRHIPFRKGLNSEVTLIKLALLAEITVPALKVNEKLWSIIMMWIARLSIKKGNSEYAAIGYAGFAMLSVRYLEDDVQAEELYTASIALLKKYENPQTSAIVKLILGAYVAHMFVPWADCIQLMDEGARQAIEEDDMVLAGLCLAYGIEMAFISGVSLLEISHRIDYVRKHNINVFDQEVQELVDLYSDFVHCIGLEGCEDYLDHPLPDQLDRALHLPLHLTQAMLHIVMAYNYGHYEEADRLIKAYSSDVKELKEHFITGVYFAYEAMVLVALNDQKHHAYLSGQKRRLREIKSVFKYWVKRNPYVYGYHYKMCEGALAQLAGDYYSGEQAYEKAIDLADKEGSIYGAAVATVALASHCRQYNRPHMAKFYRIEGGEKFEQWQGHGINQAILKEEKVLINAEEVSSRWTEEDQDKDKFLTNVYALTEQISGEASLIVTSLAELIAEKFSSDQLVVVMEHGGLLQVEAAVETPCPLKVNIDQVACISVKAIKNVCYHNETAVINEGDDHHLATYDAYIMDQAAGHILVVPICYRQACIGVLYLERSEPFEDMDVKMVERVSDYAGHLVGRSYEDGDLALDGQVQLNEDEDKVMASLEAGKSIKQISIDLDFPMNQMLKALLAIYEKFDADNRVELIAKYKQKG